jgi:AraC-like DNA-binding protein
MRIAIKSLRFSNITISEIAKESGFNFDTYFIKQFIKRYGISPSEFRKQAVKKRKDDFDNDGIFNAIYDKS